MSQIMNPFPDNWWLWFALGFITIPFLACALRYTRARRRRSLANIYGAGFYLSIKQPRPNYRIERM